MKTKAKLLPVVLLTGLSVAATARAQPASAESKAEEFRAAAASVLTDEQLAQVLKFGYERKRLMDRLMGSLLAQYKAAGLSDREAHDKLRLEAWGLGSDPELVELQNREERAGLRGVRALVQVYFGKLALALQTGKFDSPEQKGRRMKEARAGMAADQLEFARKYPKAAEILNRHAAEFEKFFAEGCQ